MRVLIAIVIAVLAIRGESASAARALRPMALAEVDSSQVAGIRSLDVRTRPSGTLIEFTVRVRSGGKPSPSARLLIGGREPLGECDVRPAQEKGATKFIFKLDRALAKDAVVIIVIPGKPSEGQVVYPGTPVEPNTKQAPSKWSKVRISGDRGYWIKLGSYLHGARSMPNWPQQPTGLRGAAEERGTNR